MVLSSISINPDDGLTKEILEFLHQLTAAINTLTTSTLIHVTAMLPMENI